VAEQFILVVKPLHLIANFNYKEEIVLLVISQIFREEVFIGEMLSLK